MPPDTAPPVRTLDLAISGMTCAACAARVEKVLNRVPGVSASVNFATEKAHATLAAGVTDDTLLAAVQKAGYGARAVDDTSTASVREERAAAYRRELRLFWISTALTLPLLAQMPFMFSGEHADLLPRWLQLALATPVQFWIGRRFYTGAWNALRGGGANMDVLVALGTSIAWLFSAIVTIGMLHHHVYFEASAAIITLVLMGKLLEARARTRTSTAIEQLLRLQPQTALIERDGALVAVDATSLQVGGVFVVRPGAGVPVDGVVIDGGSTIDESLLTGESMPVEKSRGARVFAGTMNQDGLIKCRATGVGAATALAAIVRLVEAAQGSKAPVQRLADVIASIFVPAVVAIAALSAGGTPVALSRDGIALGLIMVADQLRATTAAAVMRLRALGVEITMLTGDHAAAARAVAQDARISSYRAEVLPQDKAREVENAKAHGRIVGMVGDGINDAPALAAADVGFAIGAGADVAIQTADVTLMRSDLASVADAITLSRATLRKIRQNLFFAFIYNVLGIPLAAMGLLSPVIAGAAMALSSVSVVSNSLLLKRWKAGA